MAEDSSSSLTGSDGGAGVSSGLVAGSAGLLVQRRLGVYYTAAQDDLEERKDFDFNDINDDVQFDTSDSDNNCEVLMAGRQYPSIQEFASAIPNHLLLGSLLEHLCFVYEKDPAQSRMLFKEIQVAYQERQFINSYKDDTLELLIVIGQRLAAMNLLSPLAINDEFSSVRLQHRRAFVELLHAASSSLFHQDNRYLNTDSQNPVLRTKDGLFQAQTSRYLSEFDEMSTLGKGSYGKVFKVKNKLDGQEYAVKKILIRNVTRDDCMKVLREVKVLSSLQHPNIVGYHTAWMEHVQPTVNNNKQVFSTTNPALEALEASVQIERFVEESSSSTAGSSIVFESSECSKVRKSTSENMPVNSTTAKEEIQAVCLKNVRQPQNFVPCVFLGKTYSAVDACPALSLDKSTLSEDDLSQNSQHWAKQDPNEQVQFHLMLYIQMQLCERSLKDWIQERNFRPESELTTLSDAFQSEASNILKKILEGVEYIHSCGIMHRDLKPRNIFLHGNECHVKIGDFGLACKDIVLNDNEQLSSTSPVDANTEIVHTTGVGTFVYASPEQLEGSNYDSKSDMYSVGVIAVELFQPFQTEMERVHTLGHLRQGKVPDTLSKNWPVLTKYVRLLTSSDTSVRPSASELLQSDLFSDKDMEIHNLRRKIDEQEEELLQLRRQISELQSSQSHADKPEKT